MRCMRTDTIVQVLDRYAVMRSPVRPQSQEGATAQLFHALWDRDPAPHQRPAQAGPFALLSQRRLAWWQLPAAVSDHDGSMAMQNLAQQYSDFDGKGARSYCT